MDDQAAATDSGAPAAPAVDDYGFPLAGEMSTDDMSQEQLDAFVDNTLGINKGGLHVAASPSTQTTNPAETPSPTPPPVVPEPEQPPAPAAPPKEEAPAEPETAPQLDTSDLWIEVTNAEGVKVKLTLDDGVPDDFTFASDKQLYEILDSMQEMKNLRRDREASIEQWETDHTNRENATKSQQDTLDGWNQEISDLVDAGVLEGPKAKTDDPNYLTDPAILKIDEVFKYMTAENAKRIADNKPPLRSFGVAYNLYNNDATVKATAEKAKLDAAAAKQRGGLVGGTSAPTGNTSAPAYRRGSARTIWQVKTDDI